jgi:hypothetical protein
LSSSLPIGLTIAGDSMAIAAESVENVKLENSFLAATGNPVMHED